MEEYKYIVLVLAGVIGGFINVVAGGGSLITLPLMIFMGLPPSVANGTNRIALVAQNVVAVSTFRKKKILPGRYAYVLGFFALLGALLGAQFAVTIDPHIFNRILSVVMIIVAFLILFKPSYQTVNVEKLSHKRSWIGYISFFLIGIYGGFLHAGVGFIVILALVKINGFSLVKTNSVKVVVALIYTLGALFVFIWQDMVDWQIGLVLAFGNAVGGWLGSNFTVQKGDQWIKRVLLIAIIAMAIKLWFF